MSNQITVQLPQFERYIVKPTDKAEILRMLKHRKCMNEFYDECEAYAKESSLNICNQIQDFRDRFNKEIDIALELLAHGIDAYITNKWDMEDTLILSVIIEDARQQGWDVSGLEEEILKRRGGNI